MKSSDGKAVAIGIDLGGTKCLGVAIDAGGAVLAEVQKATPTGSEAVLGVIAEVGTSLLSDLPSPVPVGVGVPGLVDETGLFLLGPNLPGVVDLPMGEQLAVRLGAPVVIENDATCAAWAEFRVGAASSARSAVILTLGTGIGGALLAEGRIVRGRRGFTAEPGHMVVAAGGHLCACGRRGCWEAYASGTGLASLARDAARSGRLGSIAAGDAAIEAITGEQITAAADEGNPEAVEVMGEFGRWIGIGIANLVHLVAPEIVVLGGGLVAAADHFLETTRSTLAAEAISPEFGSVPVITAHVGSKAGAVGAGLLAMDRRNGGPRSGPQ